MDVIRLCVLEERGVVRADALQLGGDAPLLDLSAPEVSFAQVGPVADPGSLRVTDAGLELAPVAFLIPAASQVSARELPAIHTVGCEFFRSSLEPSS